MKKLENTINRSELRFIGISRSGNHAIINWIAKNRLGKVRFLNHCSASRNPYHFKHSSAQFLDGKKIESDKQWETIDCLMISYENQRLPYIKTSYFERNHDHFVGPSESITEILILRDPYNLLASVLKSGMNATTSAILSTCDLWINYAEEFLNKTNYLKSNKIVINYNKWAKNSSYRDELADKLNLAKNHEHVVKQVPNYAGGSSFDKLDFKDRAARMKTNERWKYFKNDPEFIRLLSDNYLHSLANEIFDLEEDLKNFIENYLQSKNRFIDISQRKAKSLISLFSRLLFLFRVHSSK